MKKRKERFNRNVLRQLRRRRQLLQVDVAEAIGVAGASIGNWERGDSEPTKKNRFALADFFQVEPDLFLDKSDRSAWEVFDFLTVKDASGAALSKGEVAQLHRAREGLTFLETVKPALSMEMEDPDQPASPFLVPFMADPPTEEEIEAGEDG